MKLGPSHFTNDESEKFICIYCGEFRSVCGNSHTIEEVVMTTKVDCDYKIATSKILVMTGNRQMEWNLMSSVWGAANVPQLFIFFPHRRCQTIIFKLHAKCKTS